MESTTIIVSVIVGAIINWIILYLVIQGATKVKSNTIVANAQFELLRQIALRNGVDEEIVNEIDNTKNKKLLEWNELEAWEKFKKRIQAEPVYFMNTLEKAYIRSEPGEGFWIKFSGEQEQKAKPGSTIVSAGILEHKEIKKKKYETMK